MTGSGEVFDLLTSLLAGHVVQISLFVVWAILTCLWLLTLAHLRPTNSVRGRRLLVALICLLTGCRTAAHLLAVLDNNTASTAIDSLGDMFSLSIMATLFVSYVPFRAIIAQWRGEPKRTNTIVRSPCDHCVFQPPPQGEPGPIPSPLPVVTEKACDRERA